MNWPELCDKIATDIVTDNSFPCEWLSTVPRVIYPSDYEYAAYDLARCLEKYLDRYWDEIATTKVNS